MFPKPSIWWTSPAAARLSWHLHSYCYISFAIHQSLNIIQTFTKHPLTKLKPPPQSIHRPSPNFTKYFPQIRHTINESPPNLQLLQPTFSKVPPNLPQTSLHCSTFIHEISRTSGSLWGLTPSSRPPCRKSKSVKEDSRTNGEVTRVSRKRPHPAKRVEEEGDEVTQVVEEDNVGSSYFAFFCLAF